jgi:hypothetical protein
MHSSLYTPSPNIHHASSLLAPFPCHTCTWTYQTSDPPPKDIVAILMTSLIGTLNTELPSQLRACSHIILLSMYTHICIYVGASPAPFTSFIYLCFIHVVTPLLSSGHYGPMQPTTGLTLQPTIGLIESICMLHSCNHYIGHHFQKEMVGFLCHRLAWFNVVG